jgi:hypothetical protein
MGYPPKKKRRHSEEGMTAQPLPTAANSDEVSTNTSFGSKAQ